MRAPPPQRSETPTSRATRTIDIWVIPIAAAIRGPTGAITQWAGISAITAKTRAIERLTAATRIGEIGATASTGIGVTAVIETGGLVRSAGLFGGTIIASGFAIADRPEWMPGLP